MRNNAMPAQEVEEADQGRQTHCSGRWRRDATGRPRAKHEAMKISRCEGIRLSNIPVDQPSILVACAPAETARLAFAKELVEAAGEGREEAPVGAGEPN